MRWKMIVLLFSLFVFVQVQAQRMEKVDKKAFGLFQRGQGGFSGRRTEESFRTY